MNNKPKCPVFGCTIPRGVPHKHQGGVSAVMRDPAEPLSSDERAELERYREADVEWYLRRHIDPVSGAPFEVINAHNALDDRHDFHGIQMVTSQETFAHSVGRIAFWVIIGVAAIGFTALALYAKFSGLAGWWS